MSNHRKRFSSRSLIDRLPALLSKYRFVAAGALAIVLVTAGGLYMLSALTAQEEEKYAEYQLEVDIPSIEVALNAEVKQASSVSGSAPAELLEPIPLRPVSSLDVYQIVVDNYVVACFPDRASAEQLLEELKHKYVPEGNELLEVKFSEKVEVVENHVSCVGFRGYDEIENVIAYIEKGTKEERKHQVKKGENYWTIAQIYGIRPEDLEAANPGVKPEALQIDQYISLIVPKPIISVTTVEQVRYSDKIEFDVVYEDSAALFKGESRTKKDGIYGEKAVVANIVRENGVVVRREVVSEEVVSNPVSKIVYRGTKDPPPRIGTGSLILPVSGGIVTCEYGVSRGAGRHTGIDVGVPVGTPIVAADGGVVIASGYSGNYGYRVVINHGANITTLYAHNSKLLVSVGDEVFKGQTIAYSGNTGYSTGPHLHFEYRINGVYQNPRKYLNF